ncbi:MAG: deaminase [Myxococcales bacterium]|nr:deaminase [Myxococcales bacterium]
MEAIHSDAAPAAIGPYAQAVRCGDLIFTSGQIALTADGRFVDDSVSAETQQVMHNLEQVLQAAGCALGCVVKTTIFLTDMGDFAAVNEVYAAAMGDHRPARATVAVAALPRGARVEIECIASAVNCGDGESAPCC